MPFCLMIQRSADSYGLPSIVKSKEDSEIDYNYDDSSRWQPCSRFEIYNHVFISYMHRVFYLISSVILIILIYTCLNK